MTPDALYLGIDIGTSGVRGCCINSKGKIIAKASQPLPLPDLHNETIQQSAAIWQQTVDEVIQRLSSETLPMEIQAIAIDGTSSTVLLCDTEGKPCGPALMYNDQSSLSQARRIAETAPGDCAAHGASSSLAKAMQLLAHHPSARHICHQADWIAASLSGRYDLSDENNSLKLGYDLFNDRWPDWLSELNIAEEYLPKVLPPGSDTGTILKSRAVELGLPENCKIIAGTTDSIAAFIATGASNIGDAVTSLGSSIAIKIISDQPVYAANYGVYSHRLDGHWLVGGASNAGGRVLLQHFTPQQLDEMTAALRPDQRTGLNYYPLPGIGERFPQNDPEKIPRLSPRPDNDVMFFQAILEGLTSIEAEAYQKLVSLGAPAPEKIITAGGGSSNPAWSKIREREIGVPVVNAENAEASYGSALLAMRAILSE